MVWTEVGVVTGRVVVVVGQGGGVKTGKGLVDAKQPPYIMPHVLM
jgi:hypothetical protein